MVFTIPALIEKKRDGLFFSRDEIDYLVCAVTDSTIQQSQIGALLMAIYLNGMNNDETVDLTRAMTHSGELFEFKWGDLLVDKHSTGGIGDKISLVLAPVLATLGFKVPMVSGRGLSFTGGTLDKLESIPGFKTKLTQKEMQICLEEAGCFIAGATTNLAPADAVLYQQRDVTGTVASLPLIVSSILSKKIAEGVKTLVIDLKVGKGTFMKTEEAARKLAKKLVSVSRDLGVATTVVLSRMDNPIGNSVGNANEVTEAIECLHGKGPEDTIELVETLGAVVLLTKGRVKDLSEGMKIVRQVLNSGTALRMFSKMLVLQGVSQDVAETLCFGNSLEVLKMSHFNTPVVAVQSGYIEAIDALSVGTVSWKLGAGRSNSSAQVDHSVGLHLLKKPGDKIEKGECWIQVHHETENFAVELHEELQRAIRIVSEPPNLPPLVIDIL